MDIKEIKLKEVSLENKRQFCKELIMSYLTEKEWKEVKDEFQKDLDKSTKTTTLITRGFNKLESIASKLVEHVNEEELLTVKQLKNLNGKYTSHNKLKGRKS
jgi:hypothetical protein